MFKLVVFTVLVACVFAGVLPKPPANAPEKKDAPAVKEVPLNHRDQQQQHQRQQEKPKSADIKEEPKPKEAEGTKLQEKSAKKEERLESAADKKHEAREGVKREESASKDSANLKAGPAKHQPVTPSAKDSAKDKKVEEVKAKTNERAH